MSVAKREDKYEPPGIVTPPGLIKYKKHEVSTCHPCLGPYLCMGYAFRALLLARADAISAHCMNSPKEHA